MEATLAAEILIDGVIGLAAVVAGVLAWRLHHERGTVRGTYLAGALATTGIVLAFFAVDLILEPKGHGMGSWWDLTELAVGTLAAVIPVLLVGWALHHPRPLAWVRDRPRAALVGLAVPAFLVLFLIVAWPGAQPVDPTTVDPSSQAYADWKIWFTQYDTVEDSTMSIVASTFLAGGLVCLGVLIYRALLGPHRKEKQAARRDLRALLLPFVAAVVLLAIGFLFQAALPPDSPWLDAFVSVGLKDTLLPGSLLVVPQLLWAWAMLTEDQPPTRVTGSHEPTSA